MAVSDLPTLIVNGDPSLMMVKPNPYPIRIDGDLPTVCEWCRGRELNDHDCSNFGRSLLRVGDRVTLATECGCSIEYHCEACHGTGTVPFATATVAKITPHGTGWDDLGVTYTDVEAL